MPNVAVVLRQEIQRLARKEARQLVGPLKKHSAAQRRTIAELKRQIGGLEREVAALRKAAAVGARPSRQVKDGPAVRFSPKWVAADRQRLDLSARDYARLVGVSMLTIYNWEKGKSKPREKQLAAWAQVRGIGKREAWRRLDELDA